MIGIISVVRTSYNIIMRSLSQIIEIIYIIHNVILDFDFNYFIKKKHINKRTRIGKNSFFRLYYTNHFEFHTREQYIWVPICRNCMNDVIMLHSRK